MRRMILMFEKKEKEKVRWTYRDREDEQKHRRQMLINVIMLIGIKYLLKSRVA